jgi:hypothetical protein
VVQVDWVQPQSFNMAGYMAVWSDGSCHEIRFNLRGSPSVSLLRKYDRRAVQWKQRNWAARIDTRANNYPSRLHKYVPK